MHKKQVLFLMSAALAACITLPAQAVVYRPGLIQAKFNTMDDTNSVIMTAAGAELVPGAVMADVSAAEATCTELAHSYSNAVTHSVYQWNQQNTTFGYKGQIHLQAGVTNSFGKYFDDGAWLWIDGQSILYCNPANSDEWQTWRTGTFTTNVTGWYDFELRIFDGSGSKGPSGSTWGSDLGIGFNTVGTNTMAPKSVWSHILDAGDMTFLRVAFPAQSYASVSGMVITAGGVVDVSLVYTNLPVDVDVFAVLDAEDKGTGTTSSWAVATAAIGRIPAGTGMASVSVPYGDSTRPFARLILQGRGETAEAVFDDWLEVVDFRNAESADGPVFSQSVVPFYTNAVLTFTVTSIKAAAPAQYSLLVSTNEDFSSPVFSGEVGGEVSVDGATVSYNLPGLETNTLYYVRVTLAGNGLSTAKFIEFQTEMPVAPEVSVTFDPVNVGAATATFDLSVSSIGASSADVFFDVSDTADFTSYTTMSVRAGATAAFSVSSFEGSIPSDHATYGRIRVVNDWGLVACSETMFYQMGPVMSIERETAFLSPMFKVTLRGTGRGGSQVTRITLEVFDNEGMTGTPVFTQDYAEALSNFPATVRGLQACGLAASTTYHVRLKALNDAGRETVSDAITFAAPAEGDNVWANTSSDVESPSSYVYSWGKPAAGKVLWFETPAVVSPVIDADTTMPSLVFGVKNCGVSAALTNYDGGFVSCGYAITGRGTLTLSNQYPIDQLTFGTNTIKNPICLGRGNNQIQSLRSQGGDLVLSGPISTPAGVAGTTLATEEFHYGTISLCGHSRDFNGKFKFSYTGGLSIRNPEALTNVSEFRLGYNWAGAATDWGQGRKPWLGGAAGAKGMIICNQSGAPLVFSTPVFTQEGNNEGVAFWGDPFVFSNATYTGEIRNDKEIDFSADFTVSNFIITSSSVLNKAGVGVLTVLDTCRRDPVAATNIVNLCSGCYHPLTDAGWGTDQSIYVRNNNRVATVGLHADYAPMQNGTGKKILFTVNNAYSGFTAFGGDRVVCYNNDPTFNLDQVAGNALPRFTTTALSSEGKAIASNYYYLPSCFVFGNRSPSADGTVIFMNPMVYTNVHNSITYFESTNHVVAVRLRGEIGLRASQWDQWYFDGNGFGGYAAVEANNTNFSSRLIVRNKGNLLVNGPLAARTVEVNDGCGVGGTNAIVGTLDSVKVAQGGALFGGEYGKGGSLTISGSLTMATGSVLRAEIPPSGQAGVVRYANGTAGKNLTLLGKIYVELDIATNSPGRLNNIKIFDWGDATVGVDAGGWTVGTSESDAATFVPRLTGHVKSMSLSIHDNALWANYKSDFMPKYFYIRVCETGIEAPGDWTTNAWSGIAATDTVAVPNALASAGAGGRAHW